MARTSKNEFDMDEEASTEETPNSYEADTSGNDGQALSLDDLDKLVGNNAEYEKTRKTMYPPAGDYRKSELWEYQGFVKEGDCERGDVRPVGRTFFKVFGPTDTMMDKEGNPFEVSLAIIMSPDKRMHQEHPTQVDRAHKMFQMALDMYIAFNSKKYDARKGFRELIEMMVNNEYLINAWCNSQGDMVVKSFRKDNRNR
jgi:hypothetical protein